MINSEFRIRPYRKQELAMLYYPDCKRPELAVHNLRQMFLRCKPLMAELEAAHYNTYSKVFTPRQVRIIVEYLGEP